MASEIYEKRKSERRCIRCAGQDERTLAGKIMCSDCAELVRQRQHARRIRIVSSGRCCICGSTDDRTRSGMQMCAKCSAYHSKLGSWRYARRKEEHVCTMCCKPLPERYKYTMCESCLARRREQKREKREETGSRP